MSEHKACYLLGHALYIPENLQEKKSRMCASFNFHLVCGNNTTCEVPRVHRTRFRHKLTHH